MWINVCMYVFMYIYQAAAFYGFMVDRTHMNDHERIIEGSLEAKLPTIWRDENAVQLSSRSEMEKVRREKMQVREKVGKSRNTVFFQCFVAPEGRKVGSLKRRVRRHLGRWEMKNCTPLWRQAHFEVKCVKTHHARSTFGSWDVEKVHAVVARTTIWAKMLKLPHARATFGRPDVVDVLKTCTPVWREAHF